MNTALCWVVGLVCLAAIVSARPSPQEAQMPYDFAYQVDAVDPEGNDVKFAHDQSNDGSQTSGSYTVLQPDGKTRTVIFKDVGDGMEMDVTYA